MVLPVWIEHTTSPLPRGCSTTELRQHSGRANIRSYPTCRGACRRRAGLLSLPSWWAKAANPALPNPQTGAPSGSRPPCARTCVAVRCRHAAATRRRRPSRRESPPPNGATMTIKRKLSPHIRRARSLHPNCGVHPSSGNIRRDIADFDGERAEVRCVRDLQ